MAVVFEWIDGPTNHPDELTYFTTPQHQSVKLFAQQYNLHYLYCDAFEGLKEVLEQLYAPQNNVAILELAFNSEDNLKSIQTFKKLLFD